MSKMDNLRAMRKAKYARAQAGGTTARRNLVAPTNHPTTSPTTSAAPSAPEPKASSSEALCGHRNMSGRTCTREQGHDAKSHRYS